MASLFDKYIYQTYRGLIKTLDNEPINGTPKPLSDGEGNELPIAVSDTDVEVGFLTSKNVFIEAYGEVIDQNGVWVGPQQGFSGSSGTSGTNGQNGSSGTSGKNGTTGVSGSSGTSGKNGTNGSSGTSGVNGSSGQTGSAGTSGTSGLSALGLPSKVIYTDNQGWTFQGSANTKTFTFNSPFANTNYSADLVWSLNNFEYSNGTDASTQVTFSNKTTTSITVTVYYGADFATTDFSGRLVLIASGESNGSGTSGTSGMTGAQGPQGANGSSGTSGQNGTSGVDGTSGTSGISQPGTPGTSGTSGTSGVSNNGTSGTSGTSGINGISTGRTYFFNNSQNSDVAPYKVLSTDPTAVAQQVITKSLTGGQQNVLVQEFITPELGFTVIPGGVQRFHLHFLKPAQNDNIETYVTLQLANSAGVPYGPAAPTNAALIGWTDSVNPVEVEIDLVLPTTAVLASDRVIIKIYLNNNDSTTHIVNWYTEGSSNYSYVTTTVAPTTGTSGTSGTSGQNGTSGVNGAQGPQGADGSSGTSGLTGAAGTSGTSGTSGGGGSSIDSFTTVRGVLQNNPSSATSIFYKMNAISTTFGAGSQTIANNTLSIFPITLAPGQTIKEMAVETTTATTPTGNVTLALYKAAVDANGNIIAGELEKNFGTIDVTTAAVKAITGVNHTLGTTIDSTYWCAIFNKSGVTVTFRAAGNTTTPANGTWMTFSSTFYRAGLMNNTTLGAGATLPTDLTGTQGTGWSNEARWPLMGFK